MNACMHNKKPFFFILFLFFTKTLPIQSWKSKYFFYFIYLFQKCQGKCSGKKKPSLLPVVPFSLNFICWKLMAFKQVKFFTPFTNTLAFGKSRGLLQQKCLLKILTFLKNFVTSFKNFFITVRIFKSFLLEKSHSKNVQVTTLFRTFFIERW